MARLGDLPADVGAAVTRAIARGGVSAGRTPPLRRDAPARGARHRGSAGRYHRCATCAELFAGYPNAERHVDGEHGHGRIEVVL